MNHLQSILEAYQREQYSNRSLYLATIVQTQGSTYRQTGARMLISDRGEMTGMISGGCLEQDILCQIQQKFLDSPENHGLQQSPFLITYDTNASEDLTWGFGLGCDGIIQILIERLDPADHCNPIAFIAHCFQQQQSGVLATIINTSASTPVSTSASTLASTPVSTHTPLIGDRLLLYPDGSIQTNLTDPQLIQSIATHAQTLLHPPTSPSPHPPTSPSPCSHTQVLLEPIHPPTSLLLFGAGRDALPLVDFAKALGWRVTVVDCRSREATRDRFSQADQVILTRREIVGQQMAITANTITINTITANTVAVIMTHNYYDDLEILQQLLPSAAAYIGVLGSRQRIDRLLQELHLTKTDSTKTDSTKTDSTKTDSTKTDSTKTDSTKTSDAVESTPPSYTEQLQQLHAPIGLDIGAETPEEIAIAILAEIQAVLKQRSALPLKHRQVAIHPPTAPVTRSTITTELMVTSQFAVP